MQIRKNKMPIEINESNDRVAEVTLTCDCCGKSIGTRLILKKEADTLKTKEIICSLCGKRKSQK